MAKKQSLASALLSANKSQPQEPVTENTTRESVSPIRSPVRDDAVVTKLPVPPSRKGKKAITGFFRPEVSKQFKVMAADEETTIQELLNEALNDFFIKKGKTPII